MKKKHDNNTIKGNKCPHCGEIFPSVIAVHQHILDDHQQIVAEERESQAMDRLRKEQERAEKDRIREEIPSLYNLNQKKVDINVRLPNISSVE